MILLPNGCRMSTPSVNPKHWKRAGAKTAKLKWYIHYRFFDENFKEKYPKGKQRIIKSMNAIDDPEERIHATQALIDDAISLHRNEGYNLITGLYQLPDVVEYEIDPKTPFPEALKLSLEKLKCEERTKSDVKNCLTYIIKSIKSLNYQYMPIGSISRKHIRVVLDNCANVKKYWSPSLFNNYRKYLSMLFNELLELEAIEHHPVTHISKQKTVKLIRQTLSTEERLIVNNHLFQNHYHFWRYMQIFFHSGRRTTELFKVKYEDVDLANQRFKVTEKKGQSYKQKWCPIKNVALPFWNEVIHEAGAEDFLFAYDLKPGVKQIRPDQITKRWKKHVKDKLGITADFYSLKHSNADDIAKLYSLQVAQGFIGHSSEAMTRIYATGQTERDLEAMKKIGNEF